MKYGVAGPPPRGYMQMEVSMTVTVPADRQALGQESVRYLQDLLRIDTTNPPGNETEAAQYLAGLLRAEGYEPRVIESAPGRGSVITRYPGSDLLPPLLVFGHLDVVMAESQYWT